MSGCSADRPAHAEEWQRDYCAKLGSWQDADTESAGDAAIAASRKLHEAGLLQGGTDILDDTVNAVGGDIGAEGRAVAYCDGAGFETLVG